MYFPHAECVQHSVQIILVIVSNIWNSSTFYPGHVDRMHIVVYNKHDCWRVDVLTVFTFTIAPCTIPMLMTSLWINISKNSPLLHVQCNMSAVSEDWIDVMWGHVTASIFIEWYMYSVLVSGWRAPAVCRQGAMTSRDIDCSVHWCVLQCRCGLQSESTALCSNEITLCDESRLQKCWI